MPSRIDETGKRYGWWTVLKYLGIRRPSRAGFYLCRCDCGVEKEVNISAIRMGKSTSCGCRYRYEYGRAARNAVLNSYISGAKKRGLDWCLTEEDFSRITQGLCWYCNAEPKHLRRVNKNKNGVYIYNGVDRIDNDKGYTRDNVVTCCGECNLAKGTRSEGAFLRWVEKVYKHRVGSKTEQPAETDDANVGMLDPMLFQTGSSPSLLF